MFTITWPSADRECSGPVFSAVADLVHHVKNDLSSSQLSKIICAFTAMMHKPALGNNLHVIFAKMMFGLTDVIAAKETPQGAARLLEALFETCLEKLESLCVVYIDLRGEATKEKVAAGDSGSDAMLVEKARPACAAVYASERPEEVFHGP